MTMAAHGRGFEQALFWTLAVLAVVLYVCVAVELLAGLA
jgi:hypothetical protein